MYIDRFHVETFPLSLCSVFACPNTLDILCDKLLDKLLKGATLVKERSRVAILRALYPQGSLSHLQYRQGASWNMNQPVTLAREGQKGLFASETGREPDHTFVFILTIALFAQILQQNIRSSVQ